MCPLQGGQKLNSPPASERFKHRVASNTSHLLKLETYVVDFANFGKFSTYALLAVHIIKLSRWSYQMFCRADSVCERTDFAVYSLFLLKTKHIASE